MLVCFLMHTVLWFSTSDHVIWRACLGHPISRPPLGSGVARGSQRLWLETQILFSYAWHLYCKGSKLSLLGMITRTHATHIFYVGFELLRAWSLFNKVCTIVGDMKVPMDPAPEVTQHHFSLILLKAGTDIRKVEIIRFSP